MINYSSQKKKQKLQLGGILFLNTIPLDSNIILFTDIKTKTSVLKMISND